MKPTLISFELCPYVQRSVITLLEKHVEFEIRYIDLASPPAWFATVSPFGKVPVLQVGDVTIFESAVINEYLDEINPPSMHPADPLQKALNRAWIEFASDLIAANYRYNMAATQEDFELSLAELRRRVAQLEAKLGEGPFFNGAPFCLIDTAFAPFFTRMALMEKLLYNDIYRDAPKTAAWAGRLIDRDSVRNSVVPDFAEKYLAYFAAKDTYITRALAHA